MRPRVPVYLNQPEYDALVELARREYRDVRGQALILILFELERRGLLADVNQSREQSEAIDLQGV